LRAIRGTIITPYKTIQNGQIEIHESKIQHLGHRRTFEGRINDFENSWILPGFIDIHVHGLAGYDAMDKETESIIQISKLLAKKGVTGFLVTIQTAPFNDIIETIKVTKNAMNLDILGAKILGSHLEGPYINPKHMGAQQEFIKNPTKAEIEKLLSISEKSLKIITLAPEIENGFEAIQILKENNVVVSASHTDSNYAQAGQAFKSGVTLMGHFWNGMRGLHHRKPGIVGAALENEKVMVELIADGYHVHPAILRLTINLKGIDNVILVSDSIKPAGLPDGEYVFNGRNFLMKEGLIKLDSGVIAGSSIGLNDAIRFLIQRCGIGLHQAVQMVTDNPARLLGLKNKGRLEPGNYADIVIMDESFNILETIVEGETIYNSEDKS
jgi:N-acetylglucosamine-6-phosphate deacetylase